MAKKRLVLGLMLITDVKINGAKMLTMKMVLIPIKMVK